MGEEKLDDKVLKSIIFLGNFTFKGLSTMQQEIRLVVEAFEKRHFRVAKAFQ